MENITSLIDFWFPNDKFQDFWFDESKDYEIFENYNELLIEYENKDLDLMLQENKDNHENLFGLIILFDQITRNIARIDRTKNYKKNDGKALTIATFIIMNKKNTMFSFNKQIFILLPFRHSRITKNLDFVIEYLNSIDDSEIKSSKIFKTFYLATLKDYSKVHDTIMDFEYDKTNTENQENKETPNFNERIHDIENKKYRSSMPNTIIKNINKNSLFRTILKFIENNNIKKIAVSLSGGIDSNVILFILNQIKLMNKIETLIAIHVNYSNRETSDEESDYLNNLCSYLNIPIVIRKINHMKRNINENELIDRQFYEEETKNIRFELYKYSINKYNIKGICLGHHKDDLIENVMMNILRDKDFLDLFVMTQTLFSNGVNLLRPLLEHHKTEIYEFAHSNNILYFKDTTPELCLRGMIRKKILPQIVNFDKNMVSSIISTGIKSNEWRTSIDNMLIDPILSTIKNGKCGFTINFNTTVSNSTSVFWSRLFVKLFHSQNLKMITNKNLKAFVLWTKNINENNVFFKTSNGFILTMVDKKLYFFEYSKFNKKTENNNLKMIDFNCSDYSDEQIIFYEKWKIIIKITNEKIRNKMTLENIIDGHFIYSEPVNENNTFTITKILNKDDFNKKIFKSQNLKGLGNYFPKCTSYPNNNPQDKFVKIEIIYN